MFLFFSRSMSTEFIAACVCKYTAEEGIIILRVLYDVIEYKILFLLHDPSVGLHISAANKNDK